MLIIFLRANVDMFAWQPSQMRKLPREVIEHHLKIYLDARPIQQRPWKQSIEWQKFIRKKIKKLLDADFIQEVHHPQWLANHVIVPKTNEKLDVHRLHKSPPRIDPRAMG
jgi:hypothetical protein